MLLLHSSYAIWSSRRTTPTNHLFVFKHAYAKLLSVTVLMAKEFFDALLIAIYLNMSHFETYCFGRAGLS